MKTISEIHFISRDVKTLKEADIKTTGAFKIHDLKKNKEKTLIDWLSENNLKLFGLNTSTHKYSYIINGINSAGKRKPTESKENVCVIPFMHNPLYNFIQ